MSEKVKTAHEKTNDYAVQRVPEGGRKGFFSVAMVSAGFCICMSGLMTGASFAMGLSLSQAIIAALVGNLILTIYGGAMGHAGAKEGVATSMLARPSFGFHGSKIIALVVAVTHAGWYAFQCGFFGQTINAMFPKAGMITSVGIAAAWGGILMMLSAYFGYKGLDILSKIVVPLISAVAIIGVILTVNANDGWANLMALQPTQPMTITAAIVAVVGSFACGAAAQGDITRYAKSTKVAWGGTIFGYMIANSFIILAGFITTRGTGAESLPYAMLALGLGFPALLVLIGAQWTTNDNNLYTASLGFCNCFKKLTKKQLTVIVGLIGTFLGAIGAINYFVPWLNVLGVALPPMAGVIVADYFILNKQHYPLDRGDKYCNWNIVAFVSWAIACVVGFAVKWGIASINSLVVGCVVYLIGMKIFGDKGKIGEHTQEL